MFNNIDSKEVQVNFDLIKIAYCEVEKVFTSEYVYGDQIPNYANDKNEYIRYCAEKNDFQGHVRVSHYTSEVRKRICEVGHGLVLKVDFRHFFRKRCIC